MNPIRFGKAVCSGLLFFGMVLSCSAAAMAYDVEPGAPELSWLQRALASTSAMKKNTISTEKSKNMIIKFSYCNAGASALYMLFPHQMAQVAKLLYASGKLLLVIGAGIAVVRGYKLLFGSDQAAAQQIPEQHFERNSVPSAPPLSEQLPIAPVELRA